MATRFNSWDSYFWEPGGPVLRNLYGLRDGADLSRREYAETNAQQFDIERGAISIPRTYDAEHLRTIHRELFKNVYEWAGEYRSVGMFKPALLQRLAAVRGRLSLCADQAAAAKWWLSMPMASVSAEGPMPKALSTRRTSPLMPGCRHQGRACPLRRARMTSNPLIVA